ncbi:MAG: hypothetical protein EHM57_03950, partial [Actinobacteria bacterium]
VILAETGEVVRRVGEIGDGSLAFQPTWSPDGSAVVYTELVGNIATLVISGTDGESIRLPRETFPYYVSWDPDGSRFVTLRNATAEGGILVEAVSRDGATEEIDRGAPYYFDWDPAGGRYLVHVGNDRLALLEPGAASQDLAFAAGSFQAPAWTEEGRVYLRRGSAGQTLAIDTGDGPRDIATVIGSAQLVAARGRTAIQTFAVTEQNGQQARRRARPEIVPGALYVVGHDGDSATEVVDHSVFSFFWSPDGEHLLILDSPAEGEMRWRLWDGETIVDYPPFRPEREWVTSFIPFFDQYATSMSLWSSDGSTFAYPGAHDDEGGIWLQRIDEAEPTKLADGRWVAWRPMP